MLYPHVYLSPTIIPGTLLLSRNSTILDSLIFPATFDIDKTPLVTFQRDDILLGRDELLHIYNEMHPEQTTNKTVSEMFNTTQPTEAIPVEWAIPTFLDGAYSTLIMSTFAHWNTLTLPIFHLPRREDEIDLVTPELMDFFEIAAHRWANRLQTAIERAGKTYLKKVIVRSSGPGHEDCKSLLEPIQEYQPAPDGKGWWSWRHYDKFNDVFRVRFFVSNVSRKKCADIY